MNYRKIFALLIICAGMTINAYADENTVPDTTVDGLHRVDGTEMALDEAREVVSK